MKFTLNITELGNAAFGESPEEKNAEIARILKQVAFDLKHSLIVSYFHQNMKDINGNIVGTYVLK